MFEDLKDFGFFDHHDDDIWKMIQESYWSVVFSDEELFDMWRKIKSLKTFEMENREVEIQIGLWSYQFTIYFKNKKTNKFLSQRIEICDYGFGIYNDYRQNDFYEYFNNLDRNTNFQWSEWNEFKQHLKNYLIENDKD